MATQSPHDQFVNIMKSFSTCMLITTDEDSVNRARPMAVAKVADDGATYLATSLDSGKITEIAHDSKVDLIFQSSTHFASLHGEATVSQDPALISELWSEAWKVWFPQGKSDPALCIIHVLPVEGEFWDQSGTNGIRYLFSSVSALLHGSRPAEDGKLHAKVDF